MAQCTATTRKGTQCKNSAVTGTDPPRCSIPGHQPNPDLRRKQAGAPPGNKNAEKHGAYSRLQEPDCEHTRSGRRGQARPDNTIENIADAIADLQQKRERLSRHIDANQADLEPLQHAKILDLLGRLDSRIARLYKQLRELTGEASDKMETDMDAVLEVLSKQFNIDLTGQ